jgi:hypothetical protein
MRIDGLKALDLGRKGDASVIEFRPAANGGRPGAIRVSRDDDGAIVEFVDQSGQRPGFEGDIVVISEPDDRLVDRVVRALACLHLGVAEAGTGCSEADIMMIEAGFTLGTLAGNGPIWTLLRDPWLYAVLNGDLSGLPSSPDEPAAVILRRKSGRQLVFFADDLQTALDSVRNGLLPMVYDPTADIVLHGCPSKRRTLH